MGEWVGGGGWEEKWRLRLNSAEFQVKLPAGAELGNDVNRKSTIKCMLLAEMTLNEPFLLQPYQNLTSTKCHIQMDLMTQ